ncbi:MAG: M16 family metallopeptidase [Microcystaceae cyanobacterium]
MLTERPLTHFFQGKIHSLPNGLSVVHQYIPTTPVVVADVWIRGGAIAEPAQWTGMAHFLEHMIFKGSKDIAPGVFDHIIENLGGITNAATSHDYVHYYLTIAARYLPDTLPYLGEILLQAAIPDGEFMREREVVCEEIRASTDDPDWLAFKALCESLYQHHPYGNSVLGEESQLATYTPNQMRCFHRTYYQPQNMSVVVVGGIEEEIALNLVNQAFSDFHVPSECPPTTIEAEPPLINRRSTQLFLPRLEMARLLMGWVGPGIDQIEEGFGLDVIAALLTGGRNARLVQELREDKQLVIDIDSSFSLQRDSSLFTISVWLAPDRTEAVEQIICDRLYELQTTLVTSEELAKVQRMLCHDYIFSTETPGQLAGLYGYYHTLASAELSTVYPTAIRQIQPEDIQLLANRYLSPEFYAITTLKPC